MPLHFETNIYNSVYILCRLCGFCDSICVSVSVSGCAKVQTTYIHTVSHISQCRRLNAAATTREAKHTVRCFQLVGVKPVNIRCESVLAAVTREWPYQINRIRINCDCHKCAPAIQFGNSRTRCCILHSDDGCARLSLVDRIKNQFGESAVRTGNRAVCTGHEISDMYRGSRVDEQRFEQ